MALIDKKTAVNEFNVNFGGVGHAIIAKKILDGLPEVDPVHAAGGCYCWECESCDPESNHCDNPQGTMLPIPRKQNDFCSYGRRREGADG